MGPAVAGATTAEFHASRLNAIGGNLVKGSGNPTQLRFGAVFFSDFLRN